jgi:hypothetical protein
MRFVLPLVVALALALAAPAGAHGFDYVTADAQVSADGTVVVEAAFTTQPAWLALHADDGGESGAVIGYTRLQAANRFYPEMRVAIEDDAWADWTTGTVHPVLHADDGDDTFDPATDQPIASFGQSVSTAVVVERGPAAYVSGEGDFPLALSGPEVTVREVALPEAGYLVVRRGNASGPVVGHTPLDAGVHRNVTVALDPAFYAAMNGSTALAVAPVIDDGDGEFDADDTRLTAGEATVQSRFSVERDADDGDSGVVTAAPTPTPPPTATPEETATSDGPGFGALLAVGALLAMGVLAWRRR